MKITDNQNRRVLSEGRNNGMGFALLEKKGPNYETVQPISPCKDYLNEVVFTENTGIPSKGCGLEYLKRLKIFKSRLYMAIKIVPTKDGSYYYSRSLEQDQEMLANNYKNLEIFIRKFEDLLGSRIKTHIKAANDGFFLVRGPMIWRRSTIAISLYTLLIRAGMTYNGKDDPIKFLETFSYNSGDASLIKGALPKIKYILEKREIPGQPKFPRDAAAKFHWSPHNLGIMSFNIPKDELVHT